MVQPTVKPGSLELGTSSCRFRTFKPNPDIAQDQNIYKYVFSSIEHRVLGALCMAQQQGAWAAERMGSTTEHGDHLRSFDSHCAHITFTQQHWMQSYHSCSRPAAVFTGTWHSLPAQCSALEAPSGLQISGCWRSCLCRVPRS